MTSEELIQELPKGLLKWHRFKKGGQALYITAETDMDHALSEALAECGLKTKTEKWDENAIRKVRFDFCDQTAGKLDNQNYDYVVIGDALSRIKTVDAKELLFRLHTVLKSDGKLFLCADNRLAIRYFCGDRDPFTGRNFDGIENYKRVNVTDREELKGQLYAKAELIDMLEQAGFTQHRCYAVFPELTCPQLLFAEDYVPKEELKIRIFPQYHSPDTIFLEEENLYTSLIENNLLHTMANGFLIECPLDSGFADTYQVTVSMDRGREHALCTIIRRDGNVEKRPIYEEGKGKAETLIENSRYLANHGVKMVDSHVEGDSLLMPYINGMGLAKYFQLLAERDKQEFFRQFDRLWELILSSSEQVPYEEVDWEHFNPWWDEEKNEKVRRRIDRERWRKIAFGADEEKAALGAVLKRGYLDMVLLNGFEVDGEFIFYDQERYGEQIPAKAIMLRNIDFLYHGDAQMRSILPREELLERYKIRQYQDIYYAHIGYFLEKLRNDELLREYHESRRRNDEVVHSNRQRINYSAEEYQKLFVDIFKHMDNRELYLFGSGNFTKKFLASYKKEYVIAGILDNKEEKWGSTMEGIKVLSPSVLRGMDASTYKVIICIKNYLGVLRQLKELGVVNVSVYDTNLEYQENTKQS